MKWIQKSAVNSKRSDLVALVISIAILVLLMVLLSLVYLKIDLTAEKRHTLTPGTIKLLSELDDHMFVRCYLHGEFPAEFKKLEQSIQERLEEFNDYSNGLIDYEFIDPYADGDAKRVNENIQALMEKGLVASDLDYNDKGAKMIKKLFPGIIVEYRGMEYPIQLLQADRPIMSKFDLVNTIQGALNHLEYQLANGLKKIARAEKPVIAVLKGKNEFELLRLSGFIEGLRENYAVQVLSIDGKLNALSDKVEGVTERKNRYAGLVVAGPDSLISDQDRFMIDQYVMNGGKVLWLIDAVKMVKDSTDKENLTDAMVANDERLNSMLYNYGVHVTSTVIADFNGAPAKMMEGEMAGQMNLVQEKIYYFPLFQSSAPNVITNNLDPVIMKFVSALDSVNNKSASQANPDVIKTPLFITSDLSKQFKVPYRINFGISKYDQNYFKSGGTPNQVAAMLLEGIFPSAFSTNIPAVIRNNPDVAYRSSSHKTKMIVIGDSDIAKSDVKLDNGKPFILPLGYDSRTNIFYDNKEFLMNCMNYLLDDADLINIRSRTIEIRLLDKSKTTAYAVWIQVTNIGAPLLLLALLGGIMHIYRNRWKRPLRGNK